ncbi:metallophosphoesterase [Planococcus lenghuensis]|uniref:Calcineurin-like phosphoesterase domain-containing protein n=1 Tax=Planococcus lenghuensis TaxID=2213202 RepID=A0A1Q2KVQ1_9BACL|nr:metallophosphoesterase [Planococcus lenghuensis]AQQ52196.1 hypothetical protein B0X71_03090 [Planococcus lenghuensis]
MRVAVLSDIHEGLNRKNTQTSIMKALADWICQHTPDVFIISGDMTAGPEKSRKLLDSLQAEFPAMKVLFVHGNHDVYADDANEAYDTLLRFPGNLGNGPIELGRDWVAIGDGGWYDYSFGVDGFTEEEFSRGTYGDFTWPDKLHAHWGQSDIERSKYYADKLEQQLELHQHKKIILVTHVVPFMHLVHVKNDPSWDFFNSMMGSSRYGALAKKYGVKKYIFGHIHTRYHEQHDGIEVLCRPLGYYPHEWTNPSADEEIREAIKLIKLD